MGAAVHAAFARASTFFFLWLSSPEGSAAEPSGGLVAHALLFHETPRSLTALSGLEIALTLCFRQGQETGARTWDCDGRHSAQDRGAGCLGRTAGGASVIRAMRSTVAVATHRRGQLIWDVDPDE